MHSIRSEARGAAWRRGAGGSRFATALAWVVAGLLTACGGGGGGGDSPAPAETVRNQLTGIATADASTLRTDGISAKGAKGPSRTNGFSGNPSKTFTLSTEQLSAPFMLASVNDSLAGVATVNGRANVTPLTSLLAVALFGQRPVDAFNDYGDASAEQIALINDAEIQRAQADATEFIETALNVRVRSGNASFVTTEFQPVAGDPMWDTLVDLNARIAELGPDAYEALLGAFVQRQHDCRRMQVRFSVAGATTRFCPSSTASTPDESDAGVLNHVFSQTSGETLTLRTRGDTVIDLAYATADGARYACAGAGCAGLTLGAAAFDTTRGVALASVVLTGSGASATTIGHLVTTVPNVALADLPCFIGYVHQIGADGGVASECVDNSTSLFVFNVSGTGGSQLGASSYADYTTNNLNVVLNGGQLVSVTAMVAGADGSSVIAECRGADCQGVTVGPTTVNMNFGIQTGTRTVNLDGTVLRALDAQGNLTSDTPVRLKASLRLIYYSNVDFNYLTPDATPKCDGGQTILALLAPDDTPRWKYQVCSADSLPVYSTPLESGGLQISFNGSVLLIDTDADGQVIRARITANYGSSVLSEFFGCDGLIGCRDVQVGAPDANGGRHVSIAGAVFRGVGFDGFASGARTGRVDAAFDVVSSGG